MARIFQNIDSSWVLPVSIRRGNAMPLDTTDVWFPTFGDRPQKAKEKAAIYAASKSNTSYVGQILSVIEGHLEDKKFVPDTEDEDFGIYIIIDEKGTLLKISDIGIDNSQIGLYREAIYSSITKTDDGYIIPVPTLNDTIGGEFIKGTSSLHINGIKYNMSEYVEGVAVIDEKGVVTGFEKSSDDICNAIKFDLFDLTIDSKGDKYTNTGDEIIITAQFKNNDKVE